MARFALAREAEVGQPGAAAARRMSALGALRLVRPNAAHTRLEACEDALAQLEGQLGDRSVRIAALVGTQREGKSTLLNLLCRSGGAGGAAPAQQGFRTGHTLDPETTGLWARLRGGERGDGPAVLLIDSEGLDSPHVPPFYNWALAALTLLVSDVYLYQSRGSIDARTVDRLDVILRVSEQLLLAKRPGQAQLQAQAPQQQYRPSFIWLLRDHQLSLKQSAKAEMLDKLSEGAHRALVRCFGPDGFDCAPLPCPAATPADLPRIDQLPLSALEPSFQEELLLLERRLAGLLARPKPREVCGRDLAALLRTYCRAISEREGGLRAIQELPTQAQMLATIAAERAVRAGLEAYDGFMGEHLGQLEAVAAAAAAAGQQHQHQHEQSASAEGSLMRSVGLAHRAATARALDAFRAVALGDHEDEENAKGLAQLTDKLEGWGSELALAPAWVLDQPEHEQQAPPQQQQQRQLLRRPAVVERRALRTGRLAHFLARAHAVEEAQSVQALKRAAEELERWQQQQHGAATRAARGEHEGHATEQVEEFDRAHGRLTTQLERALATRRLVHGAGSELEREMLAVAARVRAARESQLAACVQQATLALAAQASRELFEAGEARLRAAEQRLEAATGAAAARLEAEVARALAGVEREREAAVASAADAHEARLRALEQHLAAEAAARGALALALAEEREARARAEQALGEREQQLRAELAAVQAELAHAAQADRAAMRAELAECRAAQGALERAAANGEERAARALGEAEARTAAAARAAAAAARDEGERRLLEARAELLREGEEAAALALAQGRERALAEARDRDLALATQAAELRAQREADRHADALARRADEDRLARLDEALDAARAQLAGLEARAAAQAADALQAARAAADAATRAHDAARAEGDRLAADTRAELDRLHASLPARAKLLEDKLAGRERELEERCRDAAAAMLSRAAGEIAQELKSGAEALDALRTALGKKEVELVQLWDAIAHVSSNLNDVFAKLDDIKPRRQSLTQT